MISSVDNLTEIINPHTSQSSQAVNTEPLKKHGLTKQLSPSIETETSSNLEIKIEKVIKSESTFSAPLAPTATQLLEASIEKVATKELPIVSELISESKESSSAIQAQAKLTQSLASCFRTNQSESKMKDINLNNKTTGVIIYLLILFLLVLHKFFHKLSFFYDRKVQ